MLFQKQQSIGRIGENAVKAYYTQQGCQIEDVSNNEEYFKDDIDMFINGQSIEIKTDQNIERYGNICVELISNMDKAYYRKGWFITSKAQIYIFYSTQTKIAYQVFAYDLRECYYRNQSSIRIKNLSFNEFGNVVKDSQIALIPLELIERECKTFRRVDMSI